jgi:hypothetical protein
MKTVQMPTVGTERSAGRTDGLTALLECWDGCDVSVGEAQRNI